MSSNQVEVCGRIDVSRQVEGRDGRFFVYLVVLPANDPYSRPQVVEVTSSKSLGRKGDDVSVVCALEGYSRTYEVKDKETGEIRQERGANMRLRAVPV